MSTMVSTPAANFRVARLQCVMYGPPENHLYGPVLMFSGVMSTAVGTSWVALPHKTTVSWGTRS